MVSTCQREGLSPVRLTNPEDAILAVYRSDLIRRHAHVFRECLANLDPCVLSLATGRLEGLVALLGAFDDAVMQCWPWLEPRLISHSTEGSVVAGEGCCDCGNESLKLCSPQRVVCAADGSVLVADWGNRRVCRWIGGCGEVLAEGSLNFTYGVCCDSTGVVYATTDDAVVCVGKVEESLATKTHWLRVPASAGLCDHCGLCLDAQGTLYVADHLNDRILRHTQQRDLLEVFLGPDFSDGHSTSRLDCPADVEISSDGVLFVADRGSGRILSCKSKGTATILVSNLEQPYALASRGDLLYVAEFGRNRVLCMQVTSSSMNALLQINAPTGLCFDTIGKLYVTERNLNRVLCFDPVAD